MAQPNPQLLKNARVILQMIKDFEYENLVNFILNHQDPNWRVFPLLKRFAFENLNLNFQSHRIAFFRQCKLFVEEYDRELEKLMVPLVRRMDRKPVEPKLIHHFKEEEPPSSIN